MCMLLDIAARITDPRGAIEQHERVIPHFYHPSYVRAVSLGAVKLGKTHNFGLTRRRRGSDAQTPKATFEGARRSRWEHPEVFTILS